MVLLSQLGIDYTFLVISLFFLITILVLMFVLQKYHNAFLKREELTTGATQNTSELQTQLLSLQKEYELKARKSAAELKAIMDQARTAATKTREEKLSETRAHCQKKISDARKQIEDQKVKLSSDLLSERKVIKEAIQTKLSGSNI